MARKKEGRETITIYTTPEIKENLEKLASRRNVSSSTLGNEFILQGLNGEVTRDNIDFLAMIMREQLKSIIDPSIERLASLSAKTCVQSSIAAYLTADAILKFVPSSQREDVTTSYENAKKKAVKYLKSKSDD